ncbi:MAG: beta-hydroxyacyl-ACP dehydratase [Mariniblastus sp.]
MRWFWIDRFTEFVSGQSATAVKSVSLSEESVDEYAPGRTYCPTSLIIEGLAQTGGLLIGQMSDFKDRVVLAKITKSKFNFEAYPGDTLTYRVTIENQEGIGAMVKGTSHIGDRQHGEIELMFASLDDQRFENVELFEPAQFCRMIRLLRLFEVGVYSDGTPVKVPEHMLEAEKAYLKVGV